MVYHMCGAQLTWAGGWWWYSLQAMMGIELHHRALPCQQTVPSPWSGAAPPATFLDGPTKPLHETLGGYE